MKIKFKNIFLNLLFSCYLSSLIEMKVRSGNVLAFNQGPNNSGNVLRPCYVPRAQLGSYCRHVASKVAGIFSEQSCTFTCICYRSDWRKEIWRKQYRTGTISKTLIQSYLDSFFKRHTESRFRKFPPLRDTFENL